MIGKNVSFAILLVGVFAAAFFAYSLVESSNAVMYGSSFSHSDERFQQFVGEELPDKCVAPAGYSQQDWETHMSHHPDMYKECL